MFVLVVLNIDIVPNVLILIHSFISRLTQAFSNEPKLQPVFNYASCSYNMKWHWWILYKLYSEDVSLVRSTVVVLLTDIFCKVLIIQETKNMILRLTKALTNYPKLQHLL